jgi:hypothetical protein
MYMTASRVRLAIVDKKREGGRLTLLGVDKVLSSSLGVGISLKVGRLIRSLDLIGLVASAETGGEAPLVAGDEGRRADDGICETGDESAANDERGKRAVTHRQ